MLLCAQGLMRCKAARTWAGIFLPHFVRAKAPASAKISYALQPHKATIVLPAFARSFLLTGREKKNQCNQN